MTAPATDRRLAFDFDLMLTSIDRMRRLLVDDDHPEAVKVLASLTRARVTISEALDELGGGK